ncbi:MAG: FliM/FliN family flagellar motor switch protein [Gemmatimonadaceae bacterium]|jgi:flagellar motor switch protein FliM|nr:FliM/FliN family flagellar motor switch protein [Gemmatimonadaceae bacterium]
MASDALSQNEIDRLLGGGAGVLPDVSTMTTSQRAATEVEVAPYDFRRPHRISKERLRALEAMYERMLKGLESFFLSRLRGAIELRLQSVEQFTYGEFQLGLPAPCASFVVDVNGRDGSKGIIDIGIEFAYYLVDRLFGGGASATILTRALTPLEVNAVRVAADRIAVVLSEAWQEVISLELDISGFESSPEILQAGNRDDPVLVANVEVVLPGASSIVMICLPFTALEEYFATSETRRITTVVRSEAEIETQRRNAESSLRVTRVPVAARLPQFRMAMRDLARLAPGHVINTGITRDALLPLLVNGQPRFVANVGRAGSKLAARLVDGRLPKGRPIGVLVQHPDDATTP